MLICHSHLDFAAFIYIYIQVYIYIYVCVHVSAVFCQSDQSHSIIHYHTISYSICGAWLDQLSERSIVLTVKQ